MKILTTDIKKILKRDENTNKFLSPNVSKIDENYLLFYAKRLKEKKKYAEINSANSSNLSIWKKNNLIKIEPESIEYECNGLISPSYINFEKKNYLFLEAQKNDQSDLILIESKDNLRWKVNSNFLKKQPNTIFQSPYIYKYKNTFRIFYTKNRNKIFCETLDRNFCMIKCEEVMESTLSNEKFCIYSPSIINLNDKYFMFYGAWSDKKNGNINLAISDDLSNWKKIKENFFETNENIQIISEPSAIVLNKKIFLFFEYKSLNAWDLGLSTITEANFLKFI